MLQMKLLSLQGDMRDAPGPTRQRYGMQGTVLEQVVDHRLDVPHDG